MDRAIAGEVELGWLDRAQRAIGRTGHLLNPDLYDPAFAEWLDQDLAPHLHHLVAGGKVRHSLFNMLAGGAGRAPASAGSALTQGRLRSAIGSYSGFCLPPPSRLPQQTRGSSPSQLILG